LKPNKGFGPYDYLNNIFERTVQELHSAEKVFRDLEPYTSSISDTEQLEIIQSHLDGIVRAIKTINNPLT